MTMLAFTSSFSESSLTVMPSETVISRLIGGGPEGVWRRVDGRRIFSSWLRAAVALRAAAIARRDGAV